MLLLYDVLYVGLWVSDSSCVQLLSEAPWVVPFFVIHLKDSTKLGAWIFTDQHFRRPDNIFFFIHSWRLHSLGIGAFQSSSKHTTNVYTYIFNSICVFWKGIFLYIKKTNGPINMYNHQTSFLNLEKDPSIQQPIPKTCWLFSKKFKFQKMCHVTFQEGESPYVQQSKKDLKELKKNMTKAILGKWFHFHLELWTPVCHFQHLSHSKESQNNIVVLTCCCGIAGLCKLMLPTSLLQFHIAN